MTGKGIRGLNEAFRSLSIASQTCREASMHRIPTSTFIRTVATEAPLPKTTAASETSSAPTNFWRPTPSVPVTIYDFPSYEPQRLESWSSKHLNLPLRRDILHLAVVYEGDNMRQGTASSKTRWDVHGSHRKLHKQKGLGIARVGSKQSPIRRGGGKVFGPHPRDFGTKLNRKVYDLAWRTALSYRYRRGELIVCQDGMELPLPEQFEAMVQNDELPPELIDAFKAKWVRGMLGYNQWGRMSGRSTFITGDRRENLFSAMDLVPSAGRALDVEDVDVKNLLETARIVVERSALMEMLERHQSDLVSRVYLPAKEADRPKDGEVLVG